MAGFGLLKRVVFASKDNKWSEYLYQELAHLDVDWHRVKNKKELELLELDSISYIFFFHWSEIVPSNIHEKCKCIVVHTANLPHGRGGSPIQNQIMDDIVQSRINLLKMTDRVDSGPVYSSVPITLYGNLLDIWMTIANLTKKLIVEFIKKEPIPKNQETLSTKPYKRRRNNSLPLQEDLYKIYKFIQMLDAPGYPQAMLELGKYNLYFSRAKLKDTKEIICDVKIEER
tara:strand:- start:480 stop:1166 length:687 start_codon:yes stop_codon:yes gene_type:complete